MNNQLLYQDWTRLQSDKSGKKYDFEGYQYIQDSEGDGEDNFVVVEKLKEEPSEFKEKENTHLQKYASGEFLAHHLAYQKLEDDTVQNVIEMDGTTSAYRCTRLQVNHEGLVGYILVPTAYQNGQKPDIKVIFKGTSPQSQASVSRDLELRGAGSLSFSNNAKGIILQINQAMRNYAQVYQTNGTPISVTFAGHSLGGADAQNALNAMIQAKCECENLLPDEDKVLGLLKEEMEQFSTINEMRLFTYNSAGVPRFIAKQAKKNLKLISDKVKVEAYNQRVAGDGVQQTGETHLLSDVSIEYAKVDVLKVHIESSNAIKAYLFGSEHNQKFSVPGAAATLAGGAMLGILPVAVGVVTSSVGLGLMDTKEAHTRHLHKEPIKAGYERFDNTDPEGQYQLQRELGKKSHFLNIAHNVAGRFLGFEQHKKADKKIEENHPDIKASEPNPSPVKEQSFLSRTLGRLYYNRH